MFETSSVAARKIAVPIATRKLTQTASRGTELPTIAEAANASGPPPPKAPTPRTTGRDKHPACGVPTGTVQQHPHEIEALLEAERKRAVNASARLEIDSTVLYTLESIILSLKTTDNREYLDAMNSCLRRSLTQFLRTGTTPVPKSLPPSPTGQQQRAPPSSIARPARPTVAVPQATSTWATVARRGLPNWPTPVMVSRTQKSRLCQPRDRPRRPLRLRRTTDCSSGWVQNTSGERFRQLASEKL